MENRPIYLDYNATTPLAREVKERIIEALELFGNASSSHIYGLEAKKAIDNARFHVANLINCSPEEIIFTSGGSESNNMALKGIIQASQEKSAHIVTSAVEHPAIREVCEFLGQSVGVMTTYVPVDEHGLLKMEEFSKAITEKTVLITVMHSNNEVGTLQPIQEICKIAKEKGIPVHTDASQSVGKVPVDVQALGVDLLTIAGHKLYAPKGVGVLYVRKGLHLPKYIHGAGHESNQRAGTENIIGIVGLGEACRIATAEMNSRVAKATQQTRALFSGLQDKLGYDAVRWNGHVESRLPNTANLSFRNVTSHQIFAKAGGQIAASAGAACHSHGVAPSAVLLAMSVPSDFIRGAIRFSTGKDTTDEEISQAITVISSAYLDCLREKTAEHPTAA